MKKQCQKDEINGVIWSSQSAYFKDKEKKRKKKGKKR